MVIRGRKRAATYQFLLTWDRSLGKRNIFLKENHISARVFNAYHMVWKKLDDINSLTDEVIGLKKKIVKLPMTEEEQIVNVLDTLYELGVEKKNWNACKAFLQAKGLFIEKKGSGIEINADAYFRAREAALRDGGDREVSGGYVLPSEIWKNTGHVEGDNSVGAVVSSTEVS